MRTYKEPNPDAPAGRRGTHQLTARTTKFVDRLPEDKRVVVSPTIGPSDLLDYLNAIEAFVADVTIKLGDRLDPFMSRYIGDYVNMATKVTEAKSLIRGNAIEPPRVGELDDHERDQYRREYAAAISIGLTQLRVLHDYARGASVVNKRGQVAPWVSMSMPRLVSGLYAGIMRWAKLMAWENRNVADPMHDPVARVAVVTGMVVERQAKGRRWARRSSYDPLATDDGRGD